uniref:Putative methyltransferase n=1 Tax=viral metagenome TaxID=1070528 RepID=A0A6H1ZYW1_9ZZZZ
MHEHEVSKVVKKTFGKVFVDVGANVGYYSLLLKDNFEVIYSFEPAKEPFKRLCKNLQCFKAYNVKPIMKAVSDVNGKLKLFLTEYGGYHRLICGKQFVSKSLVNHPKVPKILSSEVVDVVTLSSFFSNTKIDLVKVDVEGTEWQVLRGTEPIAENIKRWIVEMHDPKRKGEMEEWFVSHGYNFKWIDFRGKTANHIYAWRN